MTKFAIMEPKIFGFLKKHKTGITTVIELAGFAATVYLACTEKTKAEKLLEEHEDATLKQKAWIVAKTVAPAALTGVATGGLITYNNISNANQIKDLTLATMAYRDISENYKKAVDDQLKKKDAEKVHHAAAINAAERSDLHVKGIVDTGHGHELFLEPYSKTWFYSSNQFISRAALDFCNDMAMKNGGYLSDFLEMLDLPAAGGSVMSHVVFLRDDASSYSIPSLKLEYGTCNENRHELTGEKYAVLTWVGNSPQYVDTDVLYSIDD